MNRVDLKKSFTVALVLHLTMGLGATFLSPKLTVFPATRVMEVMILPPEIDEISPELPEGRVATSPIPSFQFLRALESEMPPEPHQSISKTIPTPTSAPPVLLAESSVPSLKAVERQPEPANDLPEKPASLALPRAPTETQTLNDSNDKPSENIQSVTASNAPSENADQIGPVRSSHAKYRRNSPPPYPLAARRKREEGVVLLHLIVTPRGSPRDVNIARTSGFQLLDDAALRAATTWKFEPATRAGEAVESEVEVPVSFQLAEARRR